MDIPFRIRYQYLILMTSEQDKAHGLMKRLYDSAPRDMWDQKARFVYISGEDKVG